MVDAHLAERQRILGLNMRNARLARDELQANGAVMGAAVGEGSASSNGPSEAAAKAKAKAKAKG